MWIATCLTKQNKFKTINKFELKSEFINYTNLC